MLCAPSLHGESFGMVLTEAFAAATPVLASDIPGYRDVVRDGLDGLLVPAGDALALAEALRLLALDPGLRARLALAARERAERFAWPHVAAEVLDCYEQALSRRIARHRDPDAPRCATASLPPTCCPRVPAERLPSLVPAGPPLVGRPRRLRALRRAGLAASSLAGAALAVLALQRVGVTRVAASLLASKPGLLAAGLALMCAAMFARALAWHSILAAAPTWRRAKRRDAMQGTFIGVLMSATLPARLGEPSRALIVARRLGRARETLPVVLGTIVSQTLLNLLALAILGGVTLSSVERSRRARSGAAADRARAARRAARALRSRRPASSPPRSRARAACTRCSPACAARCCACATACACSPSPAARPSPPSRQLGAWAPSVAVLLAAVDGARARSTTPASPPPPRCCSPSTSPPSCPPRPPTSASSRPPASPCSSAPTTSPRPTPSPTASSCRLVELATALIMGMPALVNEGLSWREVRLRTMHAAPVTLGPLPASAPSVGRDAGVDSLRAESV